MHHMLGFEHSLRERDRRLVWSKMETKLKTFIGRLISSCRAVTLIGLAKLLSSALYKYN